MELWKLPVDYVYSKLLKFTIVIPHLKMRACDDWSNSRHVTFTNIQIVTDDEVNI